MDYKKLREEMTEQALSIEFVMRSHAQIGLAELSEACNLDPVKTGFILEQMAVFRMVREAGKGCFSLTTEYRKAWR